MNEKLEKYANTISKLKNLEVIIIADKYKSEYKGNGFKIFLSKINNISHKRNLGAEKSSGKYLIYNDSDILANHDYFNKIFYLIKKKPELNLFGGPNIHKNDKNFITKLISHCYKCFTTSGFNNFLNKDNGLSNKFVNFLPTCNLIIKKKAFEDIGKFNTKLITGEDIDFCKRAIRKKYKIIFITELGVTHITKDLKDFLFERMNYGNSFRDSLINLNFNQIVKGSLVLIYCLSFTTSALNLIINDNLISKVTIISLFLIIYLDSFLNTKKINIIIPLINLMGLFAASIGIMLGVFFKRKYYKYNNNSDKQ